MILAFWWQKDGALSIAVADEIAYVTSGVNLINSGCYLNAFGSSEVWFPPAYPISIGLAAMIESIQPHTWARLISLCCAIISLFLIRSLTQSALSNESIANLSVVVLACNPIFQFHAFAALSESTASMFNLAALLCWIKAPTRKIGQFAMFGFIVGLSTLTRPEGLLLLPLLLLADFKRPAIKRWVSQCSVACFAFCLIVSPYALYLKQETGRLTITNKGEVNIADGRSKYYKVPREHIEEQTLEMVYYPFEPSISNEITRYASGCSRLIRSAFETYGTFTCLLISSYILLGANRIIREKNYRFAVAVLASCAYLAVVPLYSVNGGKNLHAAIPTLSVLASAGIAISYSIIMQPRTSSRTRIAHILPLISLITIVPISATRTSRWYSDAGKKSLLRDAGKKLAVLGSPNDIVYENGATIGFYAQMHRGRLIPSCDLITLTKYVDKVEGARGQVFLAIDRHGENLNATYQEIDDSPDWKLVTKVESSNEEVSIFLRSDDR